VGGVATPFWLTLWGPSWRSYQEVRSLLMDLEGRSPPELFADERGTFGGGVSVPLIPLLNAEASALVLELATQGRPWPRG